jgi:hypothetical protein
MLSGSIKQVLASVGLGLGLVVMTFTAPMTIGVHAAAPKRTLAPKTGYTIGDMHGCVASGNNGEYSCYGPDNKTYVCKAAGACVKLDW